MDHPGQYEMYMAAHLILIFMKGQQKMYTLVCVEVVVQKLLNNNEPL
jgi:hypothetical protein